MKKAAKNKRKIYNLIPLLLIIIIFSMSIGYSALQQTLFVRGDAKISAPEYKIEIKSIKPAFKTSGTGNSGYQYATPTFSNTEGAMYSTLPNITSNMSYDIEIRNVGLSSGVLDYIFVAQDNNEIKYKIGGINTGDILAPGEKITVRVEIEYWDTVSQITSDTVATMINFEFLQYSDSYSNDCTLTWDGSSVATPVTRNIYGLDYYQISNANELAWFSNQINSGTNDINAILTDDICLDSKTFTQIGTTNPYTGIFDGQNRTIRDYAFSQNTEQKENYTSFIGLFRDNKGYIKNTNLTVNISDTVSYKPPTLGGNHTVTEYIGGLVTNNTGIISNASVSGTINTEYTVKTSCAIARPNGYYYIGGIAGQNSGVITGSYNKTKININNSLESPICNYSKYEHLYIGGLTGQNSGFISDSYNKAELGTHVHIDHKNTEYWGYIGGLIGDSTSGTIKNSYSAGAITHTTDVEESDGDTIIDTISGCAIGSSASTVSNVYYENTCSYGGAGIAATPADMKDTSLDIESFLGNYFRTDTGNINGYYPVLKWQTK